MPRYRPNVACILRNSAGEILVCERSDWPGCWQFPQGGVKAGETLLEALVREVREELGLGPRAYRVLGTRGPYRYLFSGVRRKGDWDGQEQHYVLAELTETHAALRFDGSDEFRAARWIPPAAYDLAWIAPMKREVYAQVLQEFFGITARNTDLQADARAPGLPAPSTDPSVTPSAREPEAVPLSTRRPARP